MSLVELLQVRYKVQNLCFVNKAHGLYFYYQRQIYSHILVNHFTVVSPKFIQLYVNTMNHFIFFIKFKMVNLLQNIIGKQNNELSLDSNKLIPLYLACNLTPDLQILVKHYKCTSLPFQTSKLKIEFFFLAKNMSKSL